jgi:hypothetical protein
MPIFTDAVPKKDITDAELNRRVAVIKRFKELLQSQRDRFRNYLDALDKQKEVIQNGSADDLLRHVELEEKIVADIFSIQKVIDPLEEMYRSIRMETPAIPVSTARADTGSGADEVTGLKEALEGLKAEAVVRSQQNRELLAGRMAELRAEITSMRNNPYARRKSPFDSAPAPSQIDIRG